MRKGYIYGEIRKFDYEFLYGNDIIMVYVENGVKYKLDVVRIMFLFVNVKECVRMVEVVKFGEFVVDMFVGIGYFSFLMIVYKGVRVIVIEKDFYIFCFLVENIWFNGV